MVSHSESSLKAMSRMSPPHAGHSSGNSSPTRAMSLALLIRVAAAFLGMPTGHSLAPLADVGGGERRDGGPELVIRLGSSFLDVTKRVVPGFFNDFHKPGGKVWGS